MTDTSSKSSKLRRRRFQFSLRTLLIAIALAAGLLVAWRTYVEPYRRQQETMRLIEELGGKYTLVPADKWLRWLYGDDFQNVVLVDLADCDDPAEYLEQVAALPELRTLVVGGLTFTDEDLDRLMEVDTLGGLVLDSTSVSDDGIEGLKQMFPMLAIHRSPRRAIAALRNHSNVATELGGGFPELRRIVGDKYFMETIRVALYGPNGSEGDLSHLTNLQILISHGQISDPELVHLKGLSNLQVLYLEGAQVSDAGLAHLKGLTTLQDLWLYDTQVSDAGIKVLQKSLPNCQILYSP